MLNRLKHRWSNTALLACLVWFAWGCDTTDPTDFEPEVVVEGYLEAGRRLPDLRLSRTIPIDTKYGTKETGVGGAAVKIRLLDPSGRIEGEYDYRNSDASVGLYFPAMGWNDTPIVQPLSSYELHISVPGESATITSRTLVPDTFFVANVSADTVEYLSDRQLKFELSPTAYPGRRNVYLITTVALDAHERNLTPFAKELLENSDLTFPDLRERTAPILNEGNFERTEDGFVLVRFPWVGVYFYGRNEIIVNAIDDNLYDFVRSHSVQQGGSTLPPGEIPNVLERVEGGRGIFGSYARARLTVFVSRPSE